MINMLMPKDRDCIVIFKAGSRRMYLCANGDLSGKREDAQHHWGMQLDAIVNENPFVKPAGWELAGGEA